MTPDAKMPDISPDMRDFFGLLIKHEKEANRPKDRIDYEELTALSEQSFRKG